jgi:hypothetical protein
MLLYEPSSLARRDFTVTMTDGSQILLVGAQKIWHAQPNITLTSKMLFFA